jgi:hypothetical protein
LNYVGRVSTKTTTITAFKGRLDDDGRHSQTQDTNGMMMVVSPQRRQSQSQPQQISTASTTIVTD